MIRRPLQIIMLVVTAAMLITVAACGGFSFDGASGCRSDLACDNGQICVDQRCVTQCFSDSDCPASAPACRFSLCVVPEELLPDAAGVTDARVEADGALLDADLSDASDGAMSDAGPMSDMGDVDMSMADMSPADAEGPDAEAPDVGEADMGEADMAEPDVGEPDMAEADMATDAEPVDPDAAPDMMAP